MLFLILIGIIAYAAGGQYFEMFKCLMGVSLLAALLKQIFAGASARRAKRAARRNNRAVKKAQQELKRTMAELKAAKKQAATAVKQCRKAEAIHEEVEEYYEEDEDFCEDEYEEEEVEETRPAAVEEYEDPYDIEAKELTIEQLHKRLNVLYCRLDKMKYVNGTTPEAWEKFKTTKAYRGIEWDINDAEERLARAIETEKARWARA